MWGIKNFSLNFEINLFCYLIENTCTINLFSGVDPRECDGGVSAAGPDLSPGLWTGSPAGSVVLRHRAEFCHLY